MIFKFLRSFPKPANFRSKITRASKNIYDIYIYLTQILTHITMPSPKKQKQKTLILYLLCFVIWKISKLRLRYDYTNTICSTIRQNSPFFSKQYRKFAFPRQTLLRSPLKNLTMENWLNYLVMTTYTLPSVCVFSILFPLHFLCCRQGEFVSQSRES